MSEVGFEIGGFRATVQTTQPDVIDAVRRRYGAFLVDGPASWRISIDVDDRAPTPVDGVRVERNGAPDRFDLSRSDFSTHLDLGRRTAEATLADADELTIDSLLRVVMSLALLPASGLLVHAASLARGGRGYLFPGVSGAGKTTLARLSTDATLLSDELSIVTMEAGAPVVHGTPFWGELARAGASAAVPLSGIYFPRQAPRHAVTPLGEREAVTRLLGTVMCFAREDEIVARVLDLAASLVARVPCFVLDFRRDPGFWEKIERG